jgi:hypothetical protein
VVENRPVRSTRRPGGRIGACSSGVTAAPRRGGGAPGR